MLAKRWIHPQAAATLFESLSSFWGHMCISWQNLGHMQNLCHKSQGTVCLGKVWSECYMGQSMESVTMTISNSDNLCDRMLAILRVIIRMITSIFWSAFYVSSIVLNNLCARSHLILKTNLWDKYYLYPYIINKETEAQSVSGLALSLRYSQDSNSGLSKKEVLLSTSVLMIFYYLLSFLSICESQLD